jgi:hypothetical protein
MRKVRLGGGQRVGARALSILLLMAWVSPTWAGWTQVVGTLDTPNDKNSGLAWGDFDNDGFLDVAVSHENGINNNGVVTLYQQGPVGTFVDVTASLAPGLSTPVNEDRTVTWADINNDGYLDLARNGFNRIEIYLNKGPSGSPAWGFGDVAGDPNQVINSSPIGFNVEFFGWLDYDFDNDLDLVADNHDNILLFSNNGSGFLSFVDNAVTGLPGAGAATNGDYGCVGDIDRDGDGDVLIRKRNAVDLWTNDGDGTFSAGTFNEQAADGNKGGVLFADFDTDGDFDIFWTDNGTNQVWEQTSPGTFSATGEPTGVVGDIDGVVAGDVDNDGDVDLVLSSSGQDQLFLNTTSGSPITFTLDAQVFGLNDGEGISLADYDRDGDLDLLINQDVNNELWQNNTNSNDYLVVRVRRDLGGGIMRDDIGATIALRDSVGALMGLREVNGGRGHGSQDPAYVHFGLSALGPTADYTVEVQSPGGGSVQVQVQPDTLGSYQLLEITIVSITGTVFEDVNYGGGAGRNHATALAQAGSFSIDRGDVTMELYDSLGNFVSSDTTAADGSYAFFGLGLALYTIRAVNSTVSSTRVGSDGSEVAVQTYRIDSDGEAAGTGINMVGGEKPSHEDAAANSGAQTLAELQGTDVDADGVTEWTQSIVRVDASSGIVAGVDFGFNFDAIVNTNGAEQGSLRSFAINANLLTDNASLAQSGLTGGVENSIFMIPGTGDALGRPADTNFNVSGNGEYLVRPNSGLPAISDPVVLDATTQAGYSGTPIIELKGDLAGAGANGLTLSSDSNTCLGLVINEFTQAGIQVSGIGNEVRGCFIGVDASGTLDRGNSADGITLSDHDNTIGGSGASDRNIISGNGDEGVDVDAGRAGNIIIGNYIGTDVSGTLAIGNGTSGWAGGVLFDGDFNQLGGSAPGEGNIISGNSPYGVILSNGVGNVIVGNLIGTDTSGTAQVSNTGAGVVITTGAAGNQIGGTSTDSANVVAYSGSDGVQIQPNAGTGNRILGNSIFSNTGLGIDIMAGSEDGFGVTANDASDADVGPNDLQNYPILAWAITNGSDSIIVGASLQSIANVTYRIEYFSNSAPDGSGYGQGETFLGFTDVTTNAAGYVSFIDTLLAAVTVGDSISATATDATASNTSEFAANIEAISNTLSVSASNSIFAFGVEPLNAWLAPDSSILSNDGSVAENFIGRVTQLNDGSNSWEVSATVNGVDSIRAQWSTVSSAGPWSDISAYDSDFTIATNVAVSGTVTVWFRIQTPTGTSSLNEHSCLLHVIAQQF